MAQKEQKENENDKHANTLVEQLRSDLLKIRGKGGAKNKNFLNVQMANADERKRVILLGVDASEYSVKAVEWASKNIFQQNDVLVIMTVWEELIDLSAVTNTSIDAIGNF
ncbi:hypothetical protein RFI_32586 [Reticulomyxa filosa]|uniref:UspA domain-containing protein n=1 Tax=Reticulomyxa filosa TaxID=46433 RepID=X6LVS3_RETFI|nr:hypothetical protein RFI_32586 [Reticulomyxa filosa]|eukprot:ETO04810.1 hypothetical protein RFI_32586 [Reticulomyxa filosa]